MNNLDLDRIQFTSWTAMRHACTCGRDFSPYNAIIKKALKTAGAKP